MEGPVKSMRAEPGPEGWRGLKKQGGTEKTG